MTEAKVSRQRSQAVTEEQIIRTLLGERSRKRNKGGTSESVARRNSKYIVNLVRTASQEIVCFACDSLIHTSHSHDRLRLGVDLVGRPSTSPTLSIRWVFFPG